MDATADFAESAVRVPEAPTPALAPLTPAAEPHAAQAAAHSIQAEEPQPGLAEEPQAGPAVQPIVIGSNEPARARKGWWRR